MKMGRRNRLLLGLGLASLLVVATIPAGARPPADGQVGIGDIEFIGSVEFDTGFMFADTEVGGLSGIVYDPWNGVYHALSDDKSEEDPARFYSLTIDLSDGSLDPGDIQFVDVTFLRDSGGSLFALDTLDPEGFELVKRDHLFIGSERDLANEPWIKRFDLDGQENTTLPLPDYYFPDGSPQTSGVFTNLAFESLAVTPNARYLYAATENALAQDGPIATISDPSPSRVIEYRIKGNKMNHLEATGEFVYVVDPIPFQEPGRFADNGLVELEAIDNFGTFLAMERSFASGIGNTVRIFEASIAGASNVAGIDDLDEIGYTPMSKQLLLDLGPGSFMGVTLDNMEGMVIGPRMSDGRFPLIIVADNNFNAPFQRTLFLAFAVDLDRNQG